MKTIKCLPMTTKSYDKQKMKYKNDKMILYAHD